MQTLNHKNYALMMGVLYAIVTLSGCKGAQEAAGWHKIAPDAASIQPLRALEIPPGFHNTPSDRPVSSKVQQKTPSKAPAAVKPCGADQAEQSLLEHVQPHSQ